MPPVDSPDMREHYENMFRRGDPPPPRVRQPTIGDAIAGYERLHLICHDCNPEGIKIPAADFAAVHRLSPKLTLWKLTQRLKCQDCGSRNVSLYAISPYPYGHEYRLARKGFVR
jgi:hypothetical protein